DVELSFYIQNNALLAKSAAYVDYNTVPFYQGLSEQTGIAVDWQTYAEGADYVASYNLLLQEEELPSIIFGDLCGGASASTELYGDGLIYDLTEYLPVYAPDFWEYINLPENEANKKAITNSNGQFLFFPFIQESDYNITYLGPVIRQDWLDELGLETPVTLEDWENVLKAFKENYGAYFSFSLSRYNNAGLAGGTGAFAPFKVDYFVEDGQVKCVNTQEAWKNYLEIMHRWYEEGLLDPDFSSADDAAVRSKALNGETGIVYTAMSRLTQFIADAEAEGTGANWVGFSYPRVEEGAATTYIQTRSQTYQPGLGAVITTSCSEEELIAAIKFLNYGYTEEGMLYWNFGEEGVSYEKTADGSLLFTELITGDERGVAEALKDYTGMYSAGVGIQMSDMVKAKNNEVSAEAVYAWTENTVAADYMLPPYARTEEEQKTYTDINTQIDTYIREMSLKFVTGDESLDNFDRFVEQLDAYGLQELLAIEQAAYDRYMN
ncbi:MAG: extracellular solute-binding protein, partial [Roseburia sp.]|nr:extracellular solute-binding protein [Roseburia sp.]